MFKNDSINSPFRYAGGKFYARKLILEHVLYHNHYIEPFSGGASIFFAKKKVDENHLNDLDDNLINVFKIIRDYPQELINFLVRKPMNENRISEKFIASIEVGDPIPATKELHGFFKNHYIPQNDIERAGRWYYLNRTSYSGIMNGQNMYWGYGDKFSMQPKNWPGNIKRASLKLQGVKLTSLDFEHVIDNAPSNALLFIDPPYFNADQDKFYHRTFKKEDHFRLLNCLQRNYKRLMIFLTYDNSPEIRKMYQWMKEIHDREWNYCIQRTDDQKTKSSRKGARYKGKELFILNYNSYKPIQQSLLQESLS
ncbi:DNA adenine methylase [candidate division KSB1 bacterium]|nr:DNA adenine methylase [candidate division KSB1 bacterium]